MSESPNPKAKREPLPYETPTRPPYSMGASIGPFVVCLVGVPIGIVAAVLGGIGIVNGSFAGVLGLLIAAAIAVGVFRFFSDPDSRRAAVAGAMAGGCVILLLLGLCFRGLANI